MTRSRVGLEEHVDVAGDRLVTEAAAQDIYRRVLKFQRGTGRSILILKAGWKGYVRWARNVVQMASDERWIFLSVIRQNEQGLGMVTTNQVDDASLAAAMHAAERKMEYMGRGEGRSDGLQWAPPLLPVPDTVIWSDATYHVTPEQRGILATSLTQQAAERDLLSAGFLMMRVGEQQIFSGPSTGASDGSSPERIDGNGVEGQGGDRKAREVGYVRHTEAQCSMTVRHPKGLGSGWAGLSGYNWAVFDANALALRALEKCTASLNPVTIEPGRYTVIQEPQAVATFANILVGAMMKRPDHEDPRSPGVFSLGIDGALGIFRTKLGLKVIDERISISHNPMDIRLGVLPSLGLTPVQWIEHGVLKNLGYGRDRSVDDYSLGLLNENLPVKATGSYQMSGGETSIEEMIASTERGLLVSRFSNVRMTTHGKLSLLHTGTTRDGLWLVEQGKISKSVKNMRFTESPLFVFNQVQQLGIPVPVFNPGIEELVPVIVPPMKTTDFAFTATIDAI